MAEPIIEQIVQEIVDRVNEVTTANGFQYDLDAARPTRHEIVSIELGEYVAPKDGVVLVVQDNPELAEGGELSGSPARLDWILPVNLVAFCIESDRATTPIDRRLNRIRSDLEKKMREDPTRGGLAYDTRIQAPRQFPQSAQQTGIVVIIDVYYRTSEDDPYTQG